jgi:hypothetical protein
MSSESHYDFCRFILFGTLPDDVARLNPMMKWLVNDAKPATVNRFKSHIERNDAGIIAEWILDFSRRVRSDFFRRKTSTLFEIVKCFPRPWTLNFKLAVMQISLRVGNSDLFDELYAETVEETSLAIELDTRRLWRFLRLYPADQKLKVVPKTIELPLFKEDVDAFLAGCGHPSEQHQTVDEKLANKTALKQILNRMCTRATADGHLYLRDRLIDYGYTENLDRRLAAIFTECCKRLNVEGAEFCRNRMCRQELDNDLGVLEAVKNSFVALCRMDESAAPAQLLQHVLAWWTIDVPVLETALLEQLADFKLEFAASIVGANRDKMQTALDRYLRQVSNSYAYNNDSFIFALKQLESRKTAEDCLESAALNDRYDAVAALLEYMKNPSSEAVIRRVLEKVLSGDRSRSCARLLQGALDEHEKKK